jgi:PucR-like helix-turn-helix protein
VRVIAGIGDPRAHLTDVAVTHRRAVLAAGAAAAVPSARRPGPLAGPGVFRALVQFPAGEDGASCLDPRLVTLLGAHGDLSQTVETYLGLGGDAKGTAERLHPYRTTLYYRLRKAEQLTGADLGDGNDRLAHRLGFELARPLGRYPARVAGLRPARRGGPRPGVRVPAAASGDHGTVESVAELRERRAFECRLTPDRALGTLAEAESFLRERGLLTRTPDCALPSLYEACHEEPYQPGGRGFASWPATKWPWFGELGGRGYLVCAVHRGKNLLVSGQTAELLDPICRAELERMRAADPGWRRLLDHLAAAGPSLLDDLRLELRLTRQELRALRAPLERCGAVVARSVEVTAGAGHEHTSELARWDQVRPGGAGRGGTEAGGTPGGTELSDTEPGRALAELVVAAVRAAVIAPERELRRWFSWPWYWPGPLVGDLVRAGRLRRVGSHVTTVG